MLSYDVEIMNLRIRKDRAKAYVVRWSVGGREFTKSFAYRGQADGRRIELIAALRAREQFDTDLGIPESELRALNAPTWYEHGVAYALMKWPRASAKHRAGIGEMLLAVTPVLVTRKQGIPDRDTLRPALRWAFQAIRGADGALTTRFEAEYPPEEVCRALTWISKHSMPLEVAAQPGNVRRALEAMATTLTGDRVADTTFRRRRNAFHNAMMFAIEQRVIDRDPLKAVDWKPPATDDEIEMRYVPDPGQARALIEAVAASGPRGEHLRAFFGCMYFAAMRPSEAVMLRAADCTLPREGWGEVQLSASRPESGSGWTDSGTPYEDRGLKHRSRKSVRAVPIPPEFVAMLRDHRERFGTAPDGRLFRAVRAGRVTSNEYSAAWKAARRAVLTEAEVDSPYAAVPYSLRHAAVSLWIKSRVDPAEVAYRAGHSVAVLYRVYAKLLRRNKEASNRLIDQALSGSGSRSDGPSDT